ncbi:MAG TPA: zinc-binding dehydrogenase [Acidimicrobiia bacterium]|jgi:NADPH2:quinone reductase|nr:zinc-binding dehydrogenase [Acidimicrobiia bacterium]
MGVRVDGQATGLQLRSTVTQDGFLELRLVRVPVPEPGPEDVIVRVEASPMNPSDLGLLFAGADMSTAKVSGTAGEPGLTADISPQTMKLLAGRVGEALPVGNEGAGVVVRAGSSAQAQALMGRTVAMFGGAMYSQFRCLAASQCLLLPPGTTPAEGAAAFVNPLTALGMVETMRAEGHSALVNTAAASNLGQMLNRLCLQDGVPLVNIVRKEDQVEVLKAIGAEHVVNSTAPTFMDQLIEALVATGATLAFDAVGGGCLASDILSAMEAAALRTATDYSRYGSTRHKQVYIYGVLDRTPTELTRTYGMAWAVGGWLLTTFLQKIGPETALKLQNRVAAEITTTFASHYDKEISLAEALDPDVIAVYGKMATGGKYLLCPNKGLG